VIGAIMAVIVAIQLVVLGFAVRVARDQRSR